MSKELKQKEILPDSTIPIKKGVEGIKPVDIKYDAEGEIEKYGLKSVEDFQYTDPITKEVKKFTLDRRGTTEQKVALSLLDPKASREQKDSAISMYMFERGKQGASMLMDLWMYKGEHTKESRAFQSTMRYDFSLFLETFQMFMNDSADLINKKLDVRESVRTVDGKDKTFFEVRKKDPADLAFCLAEIASYFKMTSNLLGKRIKAEIQKRERAKGKGIYIDTDNKPHSIYEDDDVVEVVKKDKEAINKEHEMQ